MKKTIIIRMWVTMFALFAVIATLALSGCGGGVKKGESSSNSSGEPASSNSPVSTGLLTASITPADGWTLNNETNGVKNYSNGKGAVLTLWPERLPSGVKTADEYVSYAQAYMKEHVNMYKNAVFSANTHTKAGGMDAVEYTTKLPIGTGFMKMRTVSVVKGSMSYNITCNVFENSFDEDNKAFQSMIDSYTLK